VIPLLYAEIAWIVPRKFLNCEPALTAVDPRCTPLEVGRTLVEQAASQACVALAQIAAFEGRVDDLVRPLQEIHPLAVPLSVRQTPATPKRLSPSSFGAFPGAKARTGFTIGKSGNWALTCVNSPRQRIRP